MSVKVHFFLSSENLGAIIHQLSKEKDATKTSNTWGLGKWNTNMMADYCYDL